MLNTGKKKKGICLKEFGQNGGMLSCILGQLMRYSMSVSVSVFQCSENSTDREDPRVEMQGSIQFHSGGVDTMWVLDVIDR